MRLHHFLVLFQETLCAALDALGGNNYRHGGIPFTTWLHSG